MGISPGPVTLNWLARPARETTKLKAIPEVPPRFEPSTSASVGGMIHRQAHILFSLVIVTLGIKLFMSFSCKTNHRYKSRIH